MLPSVHPVCTSANTRHAFWPKAPELMRAAGALGVQGQKAPQTPSFNI